MPHSNYDTIIGWADVLTLLAHADGALGVEGVGDLRLELDAGLQEDGLLVAGDVQRLEESADLVADGRVGRPPDQVVVAVAAAAAAAVAVLLVAVPHGGPALVARQVLSKRNKYISGYTYR